MTDIATNLNTIDGSLSDIKTAIVNKGGTVSGNITTFATAIDNIPSGGSGGKYALLDRVIDDNDNEIGTVCGFFTDANDVEYAVVCLDAQYRLAEGQYCSYTGGDITNLPTYTNQSLYSANETSTYNTQKILDFCSSNGYTSTACTHCRSKSFTINNVIYYGQLPNIIELIDIFKNRVKINTLDISPSSYSGLAIPTSINTWSSTQKQLGSSWYINIYGNVYDIGKNYNFLVVPVLEIPLN